MFDVARRLYRRVVPSSFRQRARVVVREVPARLHDFPADLRERLQRGGTPLPPAFLRGRVGIDSSRAHFEEIGRRVAADVLSVFPALGLQVADYPRWLDFGCGAGRAARHLGSQPAIQRLTGVDVDASAIRWAARRLRDEYIVIAPFPPTVFAEGTFDVVYAISVFTHFDERHQDAWLGELRRMLRPGGLFITTTHGPALTYNRPDLSLADHEQLRDRGFVFRAGHGAFNDDSAFHTREYMEQVWTQYFQLLTFQPAGLAEYLDLSVWRR